ncbi:hypothetical protein [Gynuella sp.]|uniref:hypothetical protein n=1 Tax=Gynuella sp. TaxID=2969146 RepID=UPI003D0A9FFF
MVAKTKLDRTFMRTFVSFESDFSCEDSIEHPKGQELARYLYNGLRESGFQVREPQNREDWAWDILLLKDGYQIESILGYVNDSPIQWLVTTHLHFSIWKKLFAGSVKNHAENELQSYCCTIHRLLSNDRFRFIRWYNQEEFDQNVTDKWESYP